MADYHDDVMETFSALLAICTGNSPVPGEFPAQRPVTRSFHVILICAWINRWVNNREAGDLRRYRAHYDVIVMYFPVARLSAAMLLIVEQVISSRKVNVIRDDVRSCAFPMTCPLCRSLVTGGFPTKEPVFSSFDVFCVISLKKLLNENSSVRRVETPCHVTSL